MDDEPALLDITSSFLKRTGNFSIDSVESAEIALERLRKQRYDVIVSDYEMPDTNGIQFLQILRSGGNQTPFIIFTGKGREEVVIQALNSGADFYLQKGGDPKSQYVELAHKIRQAVQRQRANDALKETEQRLSDIINFLPDATFAIDRSGHIIAWNRAIEEMTGVPAAEMLGLGNYEYAIPFYGARRKILIDLLFEPDDAIAKNYARITREKGTLIAETSLPHPKGKPLILMGKASPLYNRQGEIVGAIESIRDITELRNALEELHVEEEKYREVVENSHEAIYIFRGDRFLFFNSRTSELTGYSRDELMGKNVWDLLHPDDRATLQESSARRVSGEQIPSFFSARVITKTGEVREGEFSVARIVHQGEPAILGIVRDTTERKRAEAELRESEEKMRAIFDSTFQFTGMLTPEGILTEANRTALESVGARLEDVINRPFWETPWWRGNVSRIQRLKEAIGEAATGKFVRYEVELQGAGNTRTLVDFSIKPVFDSDGRIRLLIAESRDITERKRTEEKIRESDAFNREVINGAREGIIVYDSDLRITLWNRFMEDLTGLSAEEVLGENAIEKFPFHRETGVADLLNQALSGISGESSDFEFNIPLTGKKGWVKGIYSPHYDVGGSIVGVIGIVRDITERRKTEAALRLSEERYRNVVEDQTEFISRFLPDGTHIFVNEAYCRYFGFKRDEILGHRFKPEIPDEDRLHLNGFFKSLTPEHPADSIEHRIIMPNGEIRWQQWSDRAIFHKNGELREYQSVGRDITNRKNLELELAKSNKVIINRESRLETLLKFYQMSHASLKELVTFAIEEGVKMTESKVGYLAFVNESENLLTMYAWSAEAMKGCTIDQKPIKYPLDTTGLWGEAVRQRKPIITNDYAAPNPLKKGYPKGHVPITRHMNIPVFDGPHIVMVAGVGNKDSEYDAADVRELTLLMNGLWNVVRRRRTEKALHHSNQQLQLLNSITRHDIVNQLTALHGYILLSRDSLKNPDNFNEIIEKEVSIVKVIEEQLAFMQDYQNVGIKEPVWQNLNNVFEKTARMLPMREIQAFLEPGDIEILADSLFEKVFFNLIDNSLKYGGDSLTTIRITSHASDDGLIIVYEDDGQGISPEERKLLFKPGFGKHTGLGLNLSREILSTTGISIEETGQPGGGVRFEIVVPEGAYRIKSR
ncbi:MAG TPA: PAS domain S-box protein [Methanoregulaceae archaeon]|nr:PAS domain S-box protein [Methanoregulaceae archaeon]